MFKKLIDLLLGRRVEIVDNSAKYDPVEMERNDLLDSMYLGPWPLVVIIEREKVDGCHCVHRVMVTNPDNPNAAPVTELQAVQHPADYYLVQPDLVFRKCDEDDIVLVDSITLDSYLRETQ